MAFLCFVCDSSFFGLSSVLVRFVLHLLQIMAVFYNNNGRNCSFSALNGFLYLRQ